MVPALLVLACTVLIGLTAAGRGYLAWLISAIVLLAASRRDSKADNLIED